MTSTRAPASRNVSAPSFAQAAISALRPGSMLTLGIPHSAARRSSNAGARSAIRCLSFARSIIRDLYHRLRAVGGRVRPRNAHEVVAESEERALFEAGV